MWCVLECKWVTSSTLLASTMHSGRALALLCPTNMLSCPSCPILSILHQSGVQQTLTSLLHRRAIGTWRPQASFIPLLSGMKSMQAALQGVVWIQFWWWWACHKLRSVSSGHQIHRNACNHNMWHNTTNCTIPSEGCMILRDRTFSRSGSQISSTRTPRARNFDENSSQKIVWTSRALFPCFSKATAPTPSREPPCSVSLKMCLSAPCVIYLQWGVTAWSRCRLKNRRYVQ
jgi:hypothetical protein